MVSSRNRSILNLGREWTYHIAGEGVQPVLMLSGSIGTTVGIAAHVGDQLSGCRLIVPEYAQAGSVRECLDALDAILEQEGIDQFAILGGSFGAVLAQCLARRHPNRITHLILSGTSLPDPKRVPANVRALKFLPWIPMSLLRLLLRALLTVMLRGVSDPVWKNEYLFLVSRLSKADIVSRYQVAIDLDRSYRFESDLPTSVKVLILYGEKDRITKESVRKELREIYPKAQTHVLSGAGHSAMMTHTKEWMNTVTSFLTA